MRPFWVEVEQVIGRHPAVEEVNVVAPDAALGRRAMGVVQSQTCASAAVPVGILAWARERLADYKLPERLFPVAALPRNAIGKIDRR